MLPHPATNVVNVLRSACVCGGSILCPAFLNKSNNWMSFFGGNDAGPPFFCGGRRTVHGYLLLSGTIIDYLLIVMGLISVT